MQLSNPLIKSMALAFEDEYDQIFQAIESFDRIAVFTHLIPDYDALGTQFGVYTWLKDNFKNKDIIISGSNHRDYTPRLYPVIEDTPDHWFEQSFLAIVVDCATSNRVSDMRYQKATKIVKIDHHPAVDQYGDINLVAPEIVATSEIVGNLILAYPKVSVLSKDAAIYLYTGIAGDSKRFLYSDTSVHTFAIAEALLGTGINLSVDVYNKMYVGSLNDLRVQAYILNNFTVTNHGIAYYILDANALKMLDRAADQGKEYVNIFSEVEGINAWASISEDEEKHIWRVSIRSKAQPINVVATKYRGGGHAQASGATLHSFEEIAMLIADLNALFPITEVH